MSRPTRSFISLGANVGDAQRTLASAVGALAVLPGARLAGVSQLYATRPVGVVDQPDFLNAVVDLRVPAGPDPQTGALALLVALKGLERAFGRQMRERWGPRELDLDLLLFGDAIVHLERPEAARSLDPVKTGVQWLTVPHESLVERLFMLVPLAELAPELEIPGTGRTAFDLATERIAVEGADAVRPIGSWEGSGWRALG